MKHPAYAHRDACPNVRPDGTTCGLPLRGALQTWKTTGGTQVDEDTISPPRCHVCPLLAMTSQDVLVSYDKDAELEWYGREDEANAWDFDREYIGDDGVFTHPFRVETAGDQAQIEYDLRNRRPRAVIEDHPPWRTGSAEMRQNVAVIISPTRGLSLLEEVGHTSRDVPAFSVHDRYALAAPLPYGIGMEPRAAYLVGGVGRDGFAPSGATLYDVATITVDDKPVGVVQTRIGSSTQWQSVQPLSQGSTIRVALNPNIWEKTLPTVTIARSGVYSIGLSVHSGLDGGVRLVAQQIAET
jgi:hypothetical protein